MSRPAPVPSPSWRKSSRSGSGDQCVEVAAVGRAVAVRDSKDPGPYLLLSRAAFRTVALLQK